MLRLKLVFALLLVLGNLSHFYAQGSPPSIIATGDQNFCPNQSIHIVTSVSITDADASDTILDEIFVQISEGYVESADVLTLTGTHPNIIGTFIVDEGSLILAGPATFAEFEAAILDIEFTTTQTVFTSDRSFSINLGNANYLPSTDHYYFYVSSFGITWTNARTAAANSNYFGLQGYLATITTPEEAQLAGEQATGTGWIGATDEVVEGEWRWVTGPEAGTQFWQGAVSGTPVNGEFSFWNTGEPNNFGSGGEDYAHITDPSVGLLGSWNDLPLGGDPDTNGPYHPQGYIVEFGGLPGDPDINLSAATTLRMPQISIPNIQICEGEMVTISVTTTIPNLEWYADATSTTVINTGNTYTGIFDNVNTIFVNASFSSCGVQNRRPLAITVNPVPIANNITIEQCDDASADGISIFELNTFSDLIKEENSNSIVTFFEDELLTIPINALSYTNTLNNQIVYAKVLNESTDCFAVAEVTLSVSLPTNISYSFDKCDDEQEDGVTIFDLSEFDNTILLGMPVTAQTSYYTSFNDAILNNNQLPTSYQTLQPYNDTIYVKITDGEDCLGINEISLIIKPLPELIPDETIFYCLNTFPETIKLDSGIVNDIPNNFYYNWSTGETTIEIEVNQPGVYSVLVSEIDGCSNLRTITVMPSNIAVIESIDIEDASDNNTVSINISGEGNYEFSLQSENGPYQDSNMFSDVKSGLQTVFVRDKNGCGVISETFPVVGFPKFFTPNGDGINDFWSINGFDDEFLSNSIIQIYTRYGKLITELSVENPSWDGRYRGKNMPSDDYWFSVDFTDGRSFSKHFTLKR